MTTRRLDDLISTLIAASVASAVLLTVTLLVAWLLEDIIYFSLFVAIPAGILSALSAFVITMKSTGPRFS